MRFTLYRAMWCLLVPAWVIGVPCVAYTLPAILRNAAVHSEIGIVEVSVFLLLSVVGVWLAIRLDNRRRTTNR